MIPKMGLADVARRLMRLMLLACVAMAFTAAGAQAYVYWSISGSGEGGGTTLGRADLDGSGVTHSFTSGASNPGPIAIDGAHIYWGNDGTGSIGRANLNGTDSDPTWIGLGFSPAGIAVDGSYIYWTNSETGYIGRATLAGNDIDPTFIKVGASTSPDGLAVQSGTIYVGTFGQIRTVPATGGNPLALGPSIGSGVQVPSLAVAGGYVYFGLFPGGSIGRMTTTTGSDETGTFITGLGVAGGIASDGTYLYWSDSPNDQIGRALLGSEGATDVEDDFISEPDEPGGIAVDAGIDPTTTSVSCVPTTVSTGQASACTVTIGDSASTSVPTGTVNFTGAGAAFFTGNPCVLAKAAGGASCTVGADLTTTGTQTITATYSGDPVHTPSSGTASLCAGTTSQCGGSSPPPPPAKPRCIVPKLKGKTLAQARTLLTKAHCRLGKVTKPKVKKHHEQPKLVVSSTKPGAGAKLSNGAKVALKLGAAPKKRKR
jgi:virginiamycin B lyase